MKKVKIGFWLIIIAFLLLLGYQNKEFFLQKHSFDLNLWVTAPYQSPEIYNAVLFAACFLAGLVIAYLSGLFERFKSNKTIKQLNKTLADMRNETTQLRSEIDALKNAASAATMVIEGDRTEETIPSDETPDEG
jgi:uncharacterized coiled-coil protein SlyX